MVNTHQSFSLTGKTIQVKPAFKRKITPNYVHEWAERNSVDLTTDFNPSVIKLKQKKLDLEARKSIQE